MSARASRERPRAAVLGRRGLLIALWMMSGCAASEGGSGSGDPDAVIDTAAPADTVGSEVADGATDTLSGETLADTGFCACDDGNACTVDSCDEAGVCSYVDVICEPDDDPCTYDGCKPDIGCTYDPLACQSSTFCQVGACNPETGFCEFEPLDCDDDDDCTSDSCDASTGSCVHTDTCEP